MSDKEYRRTSGDPGFSYHLTPKHFSGAEWAGRPTGRSVEKADVAYISHTTRSGLGLDESSVRGIPGAGKHPADLFHTGRGLAVVALRAGGRFS